MSVATTVHFLVGFYVGGAIGSGMAWINRYFFRHTPATRAKTHEIGNPFRSFLTQTILWPIFGIITIVLLLVTGVFSLSIPGDEADD